MLSLTEVRTSVKRPLLPNLVSGVTDFIPAFTYGVEIANLAIGAAVELLCKLLLEL